MFGVDRELNYGREAMAALTARALSLQGQPQTPKVLDLGAGQGADLLNARSVAPGALLFSVENFPEYVARLEAFPNLRNFAIDIEREEIPLAAGELDLVLSNQVFEHVKDVFWIMHQVTKSLRDGGHLVLGVPNLAAFHNRLLLLLGRHPTSIKTRSAHVRGYTKSDLLDFLESVFPGGYRLEGFLGSNFYPFSPALAKPLARIFPNAAYSVFLLLKKARPYHREFLEYPPRERLETRFYLGPSAVAGSVLPPPIAKADPYSE